MALHKLAAVDLAAKIKAREVTSVEATEAAIVRLKAAHQKCNSVVAFEDDEALAAASAADQALESGKPVGPLHGVPLAHKDIFNRVGKIASWGGNIRAKAPAALYGPSVRWAACCAACAPCVRVDSSLPTPVPAVLRCCRRLALCACRCSRRAASR